MASEKLRSGGRITIPAGVRRAANIHDGDELVVTLEGGRVRIRHLDTSKVRPGNRVEEPPSVAG